MKTTFTFSRSQQAFLVTYKIETFNENSMKTTFTMARSEQAFLFSIYTYI